VLATIRSNGRPQLFERAAPRVRGRDHPHLDHRRPDDPTVEELVAHYRALMGEHEDWDAYRQAMVAERRSVVRFRPDRAYGMLDLPRRSGS